jgi:hypothetical protein
MAMGKYSSAASYSAACSHELEIFDLVEISPPGTVIICLYLFINAPGLVRRLATACSVLEFLIEQEDHL